MKFYRKLTTFNKRLKRTKRNFKKKKRILKKTDRNSNKNTKKLKEKGINNRLLKNNCKPKSPRFAFFLLNRHKTSPLADRRLVKSHNTSKPEILEVEILSWPV